MTSLEELRTQLSDVDDQITDLYEKRMKICEDLGTCKIKNGYKTFDRQRCVYSHAACVYIARSVLVGHSCLSRFAQKDFKITFATWK